MKAETGRTLMAELTLESLAERIAALERKLAGQNEPKKDWRSVVGILGDSEFAQLMRKETEAMIEAERVAARNIMEDE